MSVADTLRNRIFDGVIAPGSHLMEISLANELGVSRTPVRGAMARLADEGLLVYLPNKGFQVRRFNAKDVFDAFSVRATLEGMGCRIVGERGLDDERAIRWHDLNLEFHGKLLKLADNRWLTEAVRRACQLPIVFDSHLRPHNRDASTLLYHRAQAEQALEEHRQIVESLSRREAADAEALMREHIIANRDLLVRHLGKQSGRVRALA